MAVRNTPGPMPSSPGRAGHFSLIGPPVDTTIWTVNHSLNTLDLSAHVYEEATGNLGLVDIAPIANDTVIVTFRDTAPANTFRIVLIG